MRSFLALLLVFLIQATTVRAQAIPPLDVASLCHGIAGQSADPIDKVYPTVSYDRCMKAEAEDKDLLTSQWSTFSPADKRHCIAETTAGGESSYTELLTCLEMSRDARSLLQTDSKK